MFRTTETDSAPDRFGSDLIERLCPEVGCDVGHKVLGDRKLLVHYVNVENMSSRGKQTFAEYVNFIKGQINFDDVVNVFVPTTLEPTHIVSLIN